MEGGDSEESELHFASACILNFFRIPFFSSGFLRSYCIFKTLRMQFSNDVILSMLYSGDR
jgi:hypothetical protein